MSSVKELEEILKIFKQDLELQKETLDSLKPLLNLLKSYNKAPDKFFDEATKAFFFKEFSQEVVHLISKITFVKNEAVSY